MDILQPLLGLDKSNPLFEILLNPKTPDLLLVHFGMHLLERVKRDTLEEQFLIARLFNADFSRKKLNETFGYDYKTMKKWGAALLSGDIDHIKKVFSGNNTKRKITPDIEKYIINLYRDIYSEYGCHSNKYIRKKVEEIFDISVGYECIRLILKDESSVIIENSNNKDQLFLPVLYSEVCTESVKMNNYFKKLLIQSMPENMIKLDSSGKNKENSGKEYNKKSNNYPTSFPSVKKLPRNNLFLHHAGLLMTRLFIDEVTLHANNTQLNVARQWISMILCGCINIEQGQKLSYKSLEFLLGPQIHSAYRQREALVRVATEENVSELLSENISFINAGFQDSFLYDPHGVPYTGQIKTLKGWIGSSHKTGKVYYQDFIHTVNGFPVFIDLDDNYYDLRDRFIQNINKFRKILDGDKNRPLTITVDRAIYDVEFMRHCRNRGIFITTWEKNYKKGKWDESFESKCVQFSIIRYRNSNEDTVPYTVKYVKKQWMKEQSFTQFTVLLIKDRRESIELSVICTNPDADDIKSLYSILRRWVQENDFLILIRLGINQITSYSSSSYEEIAETVTDREIKNNKFSRLCSERIRLRKELGFLMVKREEYIEKKNISECEICRLINETDSSIDCANKRDETEKLVELTRVKKKLKNKLATDKRNKIKVLNRNLEKQKEIKIKIDSIDKEIEMKSEYISRRNKIIGENYRKLDFMQKTYMDVIKIISRNVIYFMLPLFRTLYNNRRNDLKLLLELIQADGIIEENEKSIIIYIIVSRKYPPKIKKSVSDFLFLISCKVNQIYNTTKPVMFSIYDI